MPHITVEYTNNLSDHVQIKLLLQSLHDSLLSHDGVYAPEAIKSRAILLHDYINGTKGDNAPFVHVSVKIATGRTIEVKEQTANHIAETVGKHLTSHIPDEEVSYFVQLTELNDEGKVYIQG